MGFNCFASTFRELRGSLRLYIKNSNTHHVAQLHHNASRVPCMLRAPSSVPEGREQQKRAQLSPSVPALTECQFSPEREKAFLLLFLFSFLENTSAPRPPRSTPPHTSRASRRLRHHCKQTCTFMFLLNPLLLYCVATGGEDVAHNPQRFILTQKNNSP